MEMKIRRKRKPCWRRVSMVMLELELETLETLETLEKTLETLELATKIKIIDVELELEIELEIKFKIRELALEPEL